MSSATRRNDMFDLFERITGQIRKALQDFNMIQAGDRLAVGLSGGKDSLTLLTALVELQRYFPTRYDLDAVTIDLGFDDAVIVDGAANSYETLSSYCGSLSVNHTVESTNIGKIVFEYKKEENPCSLCANMRRGALNNAAKRLGCNKIVLAHNRDDVIETMLLSLFYEGRISTFAPVTYLDRKKLHVLRPMIFTEEEDIVAYANRAPFSVVKNPCPVNGRTCRETIKKMIKQLSSNNKYIKSNIFGALKRDIWSK